MSFGWEQAVSAIEAETQVNKSLGVSRASYESDCQNPYPCIHISHLPCRIVSDSCMILLPIAGGPRIVVVFCTCVYSHNNCNLCSYSQFPVQVCFSSTSPELVFFPVSLFQLSAEKDLVTLTYEHDLDRVRVNHRVKYLGQRSFHSNTHTQSRPTARLGPLSGR